MDKDKGSKKKPLKLSSSGRLQIRKNLGPAGDKPRSSGYKKTIQILFKNKLFFKKIDAKSIEDIIKKNFSLCWRWFYRMQIPMIIGYHEVFEDVTTFHVWGTVAMNQAFNLSLIHI